MKFIEVLLEKVLIDEGVRAVSNFKTLISYLDKRYKNSEKKIDKAQELIQSYLSFIRAGSGRTIHQQGTDVSRLSAAISIYYNEDKEDVKNFAQDEYTKVMKEIMKRIFGKK